MQRARVTTGPLAVRRAGVLLHVTSLPSAYGAGDLGPGAYAFVDFLQRAGIKALQRVRKLKLDRVRTVDVDVRLLTVDGIDFDIAVLPRDYIRQAPLSPVTEKPMARASLKQVSALLEG